MTIFLVLISVFSFFLLSCQNTPTKNVSVQKNINTNYENVLCQMQSDQRRIEIQSLPDQSCSVLYTKFNLPKPIAKSQSNKKHCVEVSKKIVSHLKDSGFTCE